MGCEEFHYFTLDLCHGFAWPVFARDDMFISHSCKDHAIIILGWTSFSTDSTRYIFWILLSFNQLYCSVYLDSSRRDSFGRWSATWDAKEHWQGCQHAPALKTSQDHVGLIIHIKWINFDQSFWPRSESFIRHYFSQIMEVARSWDNKNKRLDVVQHGIQMHPKQKWIRNTCYTHLYTEYFM